MASSSCAIGANSQRAQKSADLDPSLTPSTDLKNVFPLDFGDEYQRKKAEFIAEQMLALPSKFKEEIGWKDDDKAVETVLKEIFTECSKASVVAWVKGCETGVMCNGANVIGFRSALDYTTCSRTREAVLALDNWEVAYSEQLLRAMVRTDEGWRFLPLSLGQGMGFLKKMKPSWQILNMYANIFDSAISGSGHCCCPNLHKAACRVSTGMADLVIRLYNNAIVEILEFGCDNSEFADFLIRCAKGVSSLSWMMARQRIILFTSSSSTLSSGLPLSAARYLCMRMATL